MTDVYDQEVQLAIELAAAKSAPVFRMFGWTWGDEKRAPTQDEIRDHLQGLVASILAARGDIESVASGRFRVRCTDVFGDAAINISLELASVGIDSLVAMEDEG